MRGGRPRSERPLPAVTLAEVLATSDLPGGVVNILTGSVAEIAPWLAAHMDVNAHRPDRRRRRRRWPPTLEVGRGREPQAGAPPGLGRHDWTADPGLARLTAFLETKTVWHPKGV